MPYAHSHSVRIHYQIEGAGPALILQHGFTDSLESWYELGYVPALQQHYRLILLDARGHGRSEKPHDSAAYEPRLFVADILAVLGQLHISKADFWGYSMGGRIAFAAAEHAPERFASFIIGGAHPYRENRDAMALFLKELEKGAAALPSVWEVPISSALQARLLANDMEAIVAYWRKR